jgi:hypothetical protein
MTTTPADTAESGDMPESILCPACGYDLRGASGNRCSECGLEIDREALKRSGFAWAHRRELGRVRAYLKTVRQVTSGSKSIRYEMARPQEMTDAKSFRRVTAVLLATVLVAGFLVAVIGNGGLAVLAVQRPDVTKGIMGSLAKPGAEQDLLVPWCAGATLPFMLPVCQVMSAFYMTGAGRMLFVLPEYSAAHRARAEAVGYYTAAPLAVSCLVVPLGLVAYAIARLSDRRAELVIVAMLAGLTGGVAVVAGVVGTLVRSGQWVQRAQHAGAGQAIFGAARLLVLWLWGIVLFDGLIPWVVGFVWIVVDSLR